MDEIESIACLMNEDQAIDDKASKLREISVLAMWMHNAASKLLEQDNGNEELLKLVDATNKVNDVATIAYNSTERRR